MFRMWSSVANQLTQLTDNRVDVSRFGQFALSGRHRYTTDEINARLTIVLSMAVGGLLGGYLNSLSRSRYLATSTMAIISAFLGFAASHTIITYPLWKKRSEMRQQCNTIIADIKKHNLYQNNTAVASKIDEIVKVIMEMSLSTETRSNASQTWGHRLTLLHRLKDHFFSAAPYDCLLFYQTHDAKTISQSLAANDTAALSADRQLTSKKF